MVTHVYLNPAVKGYNVFNATITIIELVLGAIILVAALARWFSKPGNAAPAVVA
jgi:carbon starvation protein